MIGASKVRRSAPVYVDPAITALMSTALVIFNLENVELEAMAMLHTIEVVLTNIALQAADSVPDRYTVGDGSVPPKSFPSTVIVRPPLSGELYTLTPETDGTALTLLDANSWKAAHRNSNLRDMPLSVTIVR
jgi:hypothetical protein